ncbi:MAG: riboflavin synthase [Bacillota bacterium]
MFTGLVEELGSVEKTEIQGRSGRFFIKGKKIGGLAVGDSVAVNGVCLTVSAIDGDVFMVDVMRETLERSNLGYLHQGHGVNLERALKLGDRLGGHLVSGHVDGVGRIKSILSVENAKLIEVSAPRSVLRYVVSKGSIAVDGISLTVVDCGRDSFTVSIIPHTYRETTLGKRKIGDPVNLEVDMIAKYVEKLLNRDGNERISTAFLAERGFID